MRYICILPFYPDHGNPITNKSTKKIIFFILKLTSCSFQKFGSSMTKTYGNNTSKQKMTRLTEKSHRLRWIHTFLCTKKEILGRNIESTNTHYILWAQMLFVYDMYLGCVCLGPNHASQTNISSFFRGLVHFSWKLCVCPDVRMFAKQIYSIIFSAEKTASLISFPKKNHVLQLTPFPCKRWVLLMPRNSLKFNKFGSVRKHILHFFLEETDLKGSAYTYYVFFLICLKELSIVP